MRPLTTRCFDFGEESESAEEKTILPLPFFISTEWAEGAEELLERAWIGCLLGFKAWEANFETRGFLGDSVG